MIGTYIRTIDRFPDGTVLFNFKPDDENITMMQCVTVKDNIKDNYSSAMRMDIEGSYEKIALNGGNVKSYYLISKISNVTEGDNLSCLLFDMGVNISKTEAKEVANILNDPFNEFLMKSQFDTLFIDTPSKCEKIKALIGKVFGIDDGDGKDVKLTQEGKRLLTKLKNLNYSKVQMYNKLRHCGLSYTDIEKIAAREFNLDRLQNNPYIIVPFGISAYVADLIAKELAYEEIRPFDKRRIEGYIRDAMNNNKNSGNTCIELPMLERFINFRLFSSIYPDMFVSSSMIYSHIKDMESSFGIYEVRNKAYIYEKNLWDDETDVVSHVLRLQRFSKPLLTNYKAEDVENALGIKYNQGQLNALSLLKTSGIKIITGPPGSGKTYLMRGLLWFLKNMGVRNTDIKLAATTGTAAQVMTAACQFEGIHAETIHRLLDIRPFNNNRLKSKDRSDPVKAKYIIADEISFLDLEVAACLFKALDDDTTLILVGDNDQLASVGCGNILADLINSGVIEVYYLTEIMRQQGSICNNAVEINKGNADLIEDEAFEINSYNDEKTLKTELSQKLRKHILNDNGIQNTIILSSVREGLIGTKQLNKMIQNILLSICVEKGKKKPRYCTSVGETDFYVNDRIIMTSTEYNHNYYNGDIGYIRSFNGRKMKVDFSDKSLELDRSDILNMDLAYCITVHKSQGAEFPYIYMVLPRQPQNMLQKRLVYTGVTRAKKKVSIFAVEDALPFAIKENKERKRLTNLTARLKIAKDSNVTNVVDF